MDRRVLGGIGWMFLAKLAIRGLGLVSVLVLARLLSPEDFGLVAMATSIVELVALMRAFSFDIVLIQRSDAGPVHFNTAWTLHILFGFLMATVLYLLSGVGADFYNDERLKSVIQVLAISVFIESFGNVGTVYFRKQFDFQKEFNFMLSRKIFGFVVTIPLAFLWHSYWALVAGILSSSIGATTVSYLMHGYRPRLSLGAVREILSFSTWIQVNNVLFFTRLRGIDFIVGRIVGAQGLGVLALATETAGMVTNELLQPINRALFPGYADLQGSLRSMAATYLNVIGGVALVVVPSAVGLALVAEDLVLVAFGPKWSSTVIPLQVMAMYGLLVSLQENGTPAFLGLGRPRLVTGLAALSVIFTMALVIYLTVSRGLVGACVGMLFSVVIMLPINFWAVRRILGVTTSMVVRAIWRPIVATTAMAVACHWIQSVVPAVTTGEHAFRLAITFCNGAAIYIGVIVLLWTKAGRPQGAESFIHSWLAQRSSAT
ncbi:MAG: lipopolysaccharide biosynthesis protein [Nitrococcus sp.]|nr:lipopolysaccharide biosynthesis protein [Nitrococcus sp.]